jgi:Flp pilus assembly pilin Flp
MNILHPLLNPAGTYLRSFLAAHAGRMRRAWADGERGASAIELAIITGVLVLLAIGILTVIITQVNNGNNRIQTTIPAP